MEYTSKFVRMFTDIAVSDDINVEYKRSLPMKAPFDFGVLVLAGMRLNV